MQSSLVERFIDSDRQTDPWRSTLIFAPAVFDFAPPRRPPPLSGFATTGNRSLTNALKHQCVKYFFLRSRLLFAEITKCQTVYHVLNLSPAKR